MRAVQFGFRLYPPLHHKLSMEHTGAEGLEGSFGVCAERLVSEWHRHLPERLSIHRDTDRQHAKHRRRNAASQLCGGTGSAYRQSRSKSLVQHEGVSVLSFTIWRGGPKHTTTARDQDLGHRPVQRVPRERRATLPVPRGSLQPIQYPAVQRAKCPIRGPRLRTNYFHLAE